MWYASVVQVKYKDETVTQVNQLRKTTTSLRSSRAAFRKSSAVWTTHYIGRRVFGMHIQCGQKNWMFYIFRITQSKMNHATLYYGPMWHSCCRPRSDYPVSTIHSIMLVTKECSWRSRDIKRPMTMSIALKCYPLQSAARDECLPSAVTVSHWCIIKRCAVQTPNVQRMSPKRPTRAAQTSIAQKVCRPNAQDAPNSITLSGRRQVRSWSQTCRRPARSC